MPFDILINGGGIAGPSLAFWLTRHGHAVTIAEQAPQLRTGGQAVDFRGPALTVLEKMGLLEQVKAGATQMGPLVLVDGRGKEVGRLPAEVISGEVEMHWGDFDSHPVRSRAQRRQLPLRRTCYGPRRQRPTGST